LLQRAEIAEGMDRMVLLAHLITALLHFYYVPFAFDDPKFIPANIQAIQKLYLSDRIKAI